MPEIQQPDILGNYLTNYRQSQQYGQQQQDRQRQIAQQEKLGQQQDTTFAQTTDLNKLKLMHERASALNEIVGRVADGDAHGLEGAKQQAIQIGIPPEMVAPVTIADLPRIRMETGQTLQQLEIQMKKAQIDAQRANIAQSYAGVRASDAQAVKYRAEAANVGAGGPSFNVPKNIQAHDAREQAKYDTSAQAAQDAANVLTAVIPSLKRGQTGPGAGFNRSVAGLTSLLPDPLGIGDNHAQDFVNSYDAIEEASKTVGIQKLQQIGGSDTERELLTAIQTTVSNAARPEENFRRLKNQIAAAEILGKKSELAAQWIANYGSLRLPDQNGRVWQQAWRQYQKAAWADSQKAVPPTKGRGPSGQPGLPPLPPGYEVNQ